MDIKHPKRTYTSTRRQAQARQTRLQILEAARKLFFERGYSGATIEAIAIEAGVAPETVYAIYKNKITILKKLVDVTLVGDDAPVPLLKRPNILSNLQNDDPKDLLQIFASDMYEIMTRMSPIFALLRSTAKNDPEIASLQQKLLTGRLGGMQVVTERIASIGPLRSGLSPAKAAATVWALSSAEVFQLLTVDLGWEKERYAAWLSDSLIRLLLP